MRSEIEILSEDIVRYHRDGAVLLKGVLDADLRYFEPRGKAFPPPGDLRAHPVPSGARIGDHEAVVPVFWRRPA